MNTELFLKVIAVFQKSEHLLGKKGFASGLSLQLHYTIY